MNTARNMASREETLTVLYDTGQRRHRRLSPTKERPGSAEISGATGWKLPTRGIEDLSLGGLSQRLPFWEGRRVMVGDTVSVIIDLAGRRHALQGKAVHLSRVRTGWTSDWRVGVEFTDDRSLRSFWPVLVDYLLSITP